MRQVLSGRIIWICAVRIWNKQLRDQAAAYQEKSAYEKAGKPSRTGSLYEKKEMSGMQKVIYSILRILIRPIREVL